MRALYMAAAVLVVAAMPAPAVAHASPVDDYVNRNGKAVCAELDKATDGGDIFRLTLTIAHNSGLSIKDAANVIGRSATAYCPWDAPKVRQGGDSAATPPPSPGPGPAPAPAPDQ